MPGKNPEKAIKEIDLVTKKIEILEKKKTGIEKATMAVVKKMTPTTAPKDMEKLRAECLKNDQSREKVEMEIMKLHERRSKILDKELV